MKMCLLPGENSYNYLQRNQFLLADGGINRLVNFVLVYQHIQEVVPITRHLYLYWQRQDALAL